MKHIISADKGFIRAGHCAVAVFQPSKVITPDAKEGMARRLIEHKETLCPIDRVVQPQEFVRLTGYTLHVGPKVITPTSVK